MYYIPIDNVQNVDERKTGCFRSRTEIPEAGVLHSLNDTGTIKGSHRAYSPELSART